MPSGFDPGLILTAMQNQYDMLRRRDEFEMEQARREERDIEEDIYRNKALAAEEEYRESTIAQRDREAALEAERWEKDRALRERELEAEIAWRNAQESRMAAQESRLSAITDKVTQDQLAGDALGLLAFLPQAEITSTTEPGPKEVVIPEERKPAYGRGAVWQQIGEMIGLSSAVGITPGSKQLVDPRTGDVISPNVQNLSDEQRSKVLNDWYSSRPLKTSYAMSDAAKKQAYENVSSIDKALRTYPKLRLEQGMGSIIANALRDLEIAQIPHPARSSLMGFVSGLSSVAQMKSAEAQRAEDVKFSNQVMLQHLQDLGKLYTSDKFSDSEREKRRLELEKLYRP